MKQVLLSFFLLLTISSFAQSEDEREIRATLDQQTKSWNLGDFEGFMKGYWENDSLQFIGHSGLTYGWKSTLNNYKKNYPDTAARGNLSFDIVSVKRLSADYFHVTGKWMLQRRAGNASGYYTLLFRKINGHWVIVSDHSS